jgi:competence protein ComEC
LPKDFYQELVKTGTLQIVVASGYNLNLIAASLSSIAWWFLPKVAATGTILTLLAGYALMTGGEPPVVRAMIMTSLVLVSPLIGRRLPGWYVYLLSLWLIIFIDPAMIKSLSFQLSAAATAGLIFLSPVIARYIDGALPEGHWRSLSAVLATPLAAQIATAPIIYLRFKQVSWWAPLTNALVSPLIGPLTMAGFLNLIESHFMPYGGMVSLSTFAFGHLVVVIIQQAARL